jgi:hypothetical protein
MRKARKLSLLEAAAFGVLGSLKLASAAPVQEVMPVENPFLGLVPYAETSFVSDYVFGSGAIIGKDKPGEHRGVNQTFVSLGKDNVLTDKDNLSAFVWTDFDFSDAETGNGFHEIDVGVNYRIPIRKDISANIGVCSWNYPSRILGEHGDQVIQGGLCYNGLIDIEGSFIHLIEHEDVDRGEFYSVKVSKTFPLGNPGDFGFSITPSHSIGHTDNFYGSYGHVTSTPGVALNVNNKKGEPFCKFFVNFQDGKKGVEDITWGGITFPIPLENE